MNDTQRKARLNHLIATDYGKPADFARATGISKSRVSQIAGESEPFGEAAARKLAQDLRLHDDWFNHNWPTPKEEAAGAPKPTIIDRGEDWGRYAAVGERQPRYVSTEEIKTIDDNAAPPASLGFTEKFLDHDPDSDVTISQFDVTGGMGNSRVLLSEQPGIIKKWQVERRWLDANVPSYSSIRNLVIVTGFGPSMRPMFNPGDPLLVDTGIKSINHEGVFFFRVGDEGYIKILQRVPDFEGSGHVLRVISKNTDYPPFDVNPKSPHFEVLGKVLTVWRSEHY